MEKVDTVLRGGGYKLNHKKAGGFTNARNSEPATKGEVVKAILKHEDMKHHGKHTTLKLNSGGVASDEKSHARADKKPRMASGGAAKGKEHTKINIMVAPGKSDGPAAPMSLPSPAIGAPQMPPRPPVAPGVAPPMMNAGMKPPGMKSGGVMKNKVAKPQGGKKITGYEAGAGSGEGRLEKVDNYKKYVKKY